jgi:hypothetical protein
MATAGETMKTIHYAKSTILTSDDVADAVIEYAAALCNGNRADVVRVPSVAQDGTASITAMLLGPASQIVIGDADDDELETEHPASVDRLQARSFDLNPEGRCVMPSGVRSRGQRV